MDTLQPDILWEIFSINAYMPEFYGWQMHTQFTTEDIAPAAAYQPLKTIISSCQVCQHWRHLLLSSPSLWGRLVDLDILLLNKKEWRTEMLRRTGTAPLCVRAISLFRQTRFDPVTHEPWLLGDRMMPEFVSFLDKEWHRIKSIEMKLPGYSPTETAHSKAAFWDIFQRPSKCLECFKVMAMSIPPISFEAPLFANDAPMLRDFISEQLVFSLQVPWTAHIRRINIRFWDGGSRDHGRFEVSQLLDALGGAPLLESLLLRHVMKGVPPSDEDTMRTVHLPHLVDIYLEDQIRRCASLLGHITTNISRADVSIKLRRTTMLLEPRHYYASEFPERIPSLLVFTAPSASPCVTLITHLDLLIYDWSSALESDFAYKAFLASLSCVSVLRTTVKTLGHLGCLHDSDDSDKRSSGISLALPALHTIGVTDLHSVPAAVCYSVQENPLLRFLMQRTQGRAPVRVLDFTIVPQVGEYISLGALESMCPGMKVVWKPHDRIREYVCGSGQPEKLRVFI